MSSVNPVVTLWRHLMLPVKVLKGGHVFVVLFQALLLGVAAFVIWISQRGLADYLKSLKGKSVFPPQLELGIWALFIMAASLIALPAIVTAIALPVRTLWISEDSILPRMLSETGMSLRRATATIVLATITSAYFLIPIGGLAVVYEFWISKSTSPHAGQLFLILVAITAISVLARTSAMVFAPFIAVVGQEEPYGTIIAARGVLRGHTLKLTILIVATLSIIVGVHLSLHGATFEAARIRWYEWTAHGFVLWYGATIAAVIVATAYEFVTQPPVQHIR